MSHAGVQAVNGKLSSAGRNGLNIVNGCSNRRAGLLGSSRNGSVDMKFIKLLFGVRKVPDVILVPPFLRHHRLKGPRLNHRRRHSIPPIYYYCSSGPLFFLWLAIIDPASLLDFPDFSSQPSLEFVL